mmetsp:Transcript_9956/g.26393  ORF Transcript_9956/g.26393 Transcript_9956/m.26393 type:complete len:82 (+) Transcript_9956:267-512(+)
MCSHVLAHTDGASEYVLPASALSLSPSTLPLTSPCPVSHRVRYTQSMYSKEVDRSGQRPGLYILYLICTVCDSFNYISTVH